MPWPQSPKRITRSSPVSRAASASSIVARYAPGQPGFEAIYAEGLREGRRLGRYEGLVAGRRSGFRDGTLAALPDFPGGWRARHWYLVRLDPGHDGARFRIAERVTIARGHQYGPCAKDPDRMCMSAAR